MNPPSATGYFQIGGRVISHSTLTTNANGLISAVRKINDYGAGIGGLSYRTPKNLTGRASNAVNPSLRDGAISVTVGT
jgi:hypothetical protein